MERVLSRSITSLVLALLVIIASSPAQTLGEGDSLVVSEDPFNVYHRYQTLPGELDLETLDKTLVWKLENRSITTPILVEDLDRDGLKELVFGLNTGKVIALELATNETILDLKLTEEAIMDLVVGNMDGDDADEIVFTSLDGIYCYDFAKETLKWSVPMEILESEIHLVKRGSKEEDSTRHEIVLLWSDGSYYLGADHHVARFSSSGEILWSSDLKPLVSATGPYVSILVMDLDGDDSLEIFINDFGWSGIGFGGTGRNIWILNATSGALKKSMSVGLISFASPPIPLNINGDISVVVGLSASSANDSQDLFIYNGSTRSHRLVDVYNATDFESWQYLAFFPGPSIGTMVMRSGWTIHAFSWDDPSVNMTHPSTARSWGAEPIICDIDGDGVVDILVPGGGVLIIDSESMQGRAQIQEERFMGIASRASNIRLTVADVDDDQRSEVIFGYYDDTGTETAYIFLMGGLDDQTEDDTPTEGQAIGWSIILFVIGANVVLIAVLIRDWRRKGEGDL